MDDRFCAHCGQEGVDAVRPVRELATDFLGDLFAFDFRLARTAPPLFRRPGFLTREHNRGRRVRYTPPLRLYLFASFVFFGLMAATGGSSLIHIDPEEGSPTIGIIINNEPSGAEAPDTGRDVSAAEQWFEQRLERALADEAAFRSRLVRSFYYMHFLLVPIFAWILWLLYRRSGLFYVEHLVFGLHFDAFFFLLLAGALALGIGLGALFGEGSAARSAGQALLAVSQLWAAAYLYFAMRRVYGESRRRTAAKFAALVVAYGTVFLIADFAFLLATLGLF